MAQINRPEFVVVGWSDPQGSRPHLGALMLGYFESDGRLVYAGRVGTGCSPVDSIELSDKLTGVGGNHAWPLGVDSPRDDAV
jgi:ATP-dependent DNA ligase